MIRRLCVFILLLFGMTAIGIFADNHDDLINNDWRVEASTPSRSKTETEVYWFYFSPMVKSVKVHALVNDVEYNESYSFEVIESGSHVILYQDSPDTPYFVFYYEKEKWNLMSPAAGMLRFQEPVRLLDTEKMLFEK